MTKLMKEGYLEATGATDASLIAAEYRSCRSMRAATRAIFAL
jgi:hypothetical protein